VSLEQPCSLDTGELGEDPSCCDKVSLVVSGVWDIRVWVHFPIDKIANFLHKIGFRLLSFG